SNEKTTPLVHHRGLRCISLRTKYTSRCRILCRLILTAVDDGKPCPSFEPGRKLRGDRVDGTDHPLVDGTVGCGMPPHLQRGRKGLTGGNRARVDHRSVNRAHSYTARDPMTHALANLCGTIAPI